MRWNHNPKQLRSTWFFNVNIILHFKCFYMFSDCIFCIRLRIYWMFRNKLGKLKVLRPGYLLRLSGRPLKNLKYLEGSYLPWSRNKFDKKNDVTFCASVYFLSVNNMCCNEKIVLYMVEPHWNILWFHLSSRPVILCTNRKATCNSKP